MNIRELERESIRGFVRAVADQGVFSKKRVLDMGCGKQPYADLVVAGGGRYFGYDDPRFPASTVDDVVGEQNWVDGSRHWDVILCNQVVQYQPNPQAFLGLLHNLLKDKGTLVISWPTNWPEVERQDLFRFTQSGMATLLYHVGFSDVQTTPRAFFDADGSTFYLGHGAIAWK
jgi:2-polyprenyl-3-methyl-5-hydroxy-6-metoxy-1,4-benzoquinol methylase